MELVVVREGRLGFHVGDKVEVPDGTEKWPAEFAEAGESTEKDAQDRAAEAEKQRQDEIKRAEAELAALEAESPADDTKDGEK